MDGMFASLQKNAVAGLLFNANLKPIGDRKFLFSIGVPGLTACLFHLAIIRNFLTIYEKNWRFHDKDILSSSDSLGITICSTYGGNIIKFPSLGTIYLHL